MKDIASQECTAVEHAKIMRHIGIDLPLTERSPEHILLQELLLARQKRGMTQASVAEKMGTKASAVARMELALSGNKKYATPTIATLKRYAQAVGCTLEIHLVAGKRS